MRFFTHTIQEELTKGIRPEIRSQRNSGFMDRCVDLRPFVSGLVALSRHEREFTDLTVKWPFPQLFKGRVGTFLADETTIFFVDDTVDPM